MTSRVHKPPCVYPLRLRNNTTDHRRSFRNCFFQDAYPSGQSGPITGFVRVELGRRASLRPGSVVSKPILPADRLRPRFGLRSSDPPTETRTRCWGLGVPAPLADREILATVHRTGGTAVAVAEDDLLPTQKKLRRLEGTDPLPRGPPPWRSCPCSCETEACGRAGALSSSTRRRRNVQVGTRAAPRSREVEPTASSKQEAHRRLRGSAARRPARRLECNGR
jgi:hypothetical protein